MDKWRGKTAVVTGASSGIGAAIVKEFAKNGINVVGLARRSEKVDEIAEECKSLSGKIYARKCDVSDLNSIKEAFKWIAEKFTTVQILVNNAGISKRMKFLNTSDDVTKKINDTINTNFVGMVHVSREAVSLMKKSNDECLVININSVVGHMFFFPNTMNIYPVTKHAMTAFTKALRIELNVDPKNKIRITSLSPGVVKTDMVKDGGYSEKVFEVEGFIEMEDVLASVRYILETPTTVNILELIVSQIKSKF